MMIALVDVLELMHIHNQDNIVILLVNIIKMVNINIVCLNALVIINILLIFQMMEEIIM